MAQATLTPTIRRIQSIRGSGHVEVYGTVAVGASPLTYVTGGLPFGRAQLANIASPDGYTIQTSQEAFEIRIQGLQGLYTYVWDRVNAALRIFIVATQAEIANGVAINAAISGDTIDFCAKFQEGV